MAKKREEKSEETNKRQSKYGIVVDTVEGSASIVETFWSSADAVMTNFRSDAVVDTDAVVGIGRCPPVGEYGRSAKAQ